MLKRVRRLKISLGAKCRILFGAAIALIIAAALYVPWQRMEQLTEQLDRSAAGALVEQAVQQHVWSKTHEFTDRRQLPDPATSVELTNDVKPTTLPSTLESGTVARLVSINRPRGGRGFEKRAFDRFVTDPDRRWESSYYERKDGTEGYRYAQPLFLVAGSECAACHRRGERGGLTSRPASMPTDDEATGPTTVPVVALNASTGSASSVALALNPPPGGSAPLVGIVYVDMPSRIDANQLLLNRVFIFTAGLLAGTLAVITFYLITTRLILEPVRVLQETAEKVSQGDLNIRSDISTGDEFQQLSRTFNVMLANLQDNQEQLRSINKSLDLRLGQLAESNLALYESNRLKSEFLANVSHELRTPLNSILGFADLLKDALARSSAVGADGKSARYVGNILQSGRHLLDLINDLLDLAKIEAGKMEIRSEPLSLGDLFEGLSNILKPLLEQKDLTLVTNVAPGVPIIHSDPAKLQQVLYNFLSNAIKFSPPGGRINLTASREDEDGSGDEDHVRIAVTDRGPGIAPENQRIIFEKFRQLDAGMTRTHGGTGLGLSIAKELTTILGGSIGVRSAVGAGATFWVVLPLRISSGAADVRPKLVLT